MSKWKLPAESEHAKNENIAYKLGATQAAFENLLLRVETISSNCQDKIAKKLFQELLNSYKK